MKKVLSFLIMFAILFMISIVASPYYRLYQLQQAYQNKDTAFINQRIHFPKLQQNIRQQLAPKLAKNIAPIAKSPLLQAVGINNEQMADKLVGTLVNRYITADSIDQIIQGKTPSNEMMGVIAVAMGKISPYDLLNQDFSKLANHSLKTNQKTDVKLRYCGLSCFQAMTVYQNYPITLTLERQGLWQWKIVNITLNE